MTRAEFAQLALAAQKDPKPLIERLFMIATKGLPGQAALSKLIFNKPQQKIHDGILQRRNAGLLPREIILKARQPGVSTQGAGYVTETALVRPYSNSLIVAHQELPAQKIYKKCQFMLDQLPAGFKPKLEVDRRMELTLGSMPCSDGEVQLKSSIFVGTAGGDEPWRGLTVTTLHVSELAYWYYAESAITGMVQAVPLTPDSLILIESTANGVGNVFHQEWLRAESGESDFMPIFIPWWELPDAFMDPPRDFEPDQDEKEMARAYGLTPAQLQWRRYMLYTYCRGDQDYFDQEYPDTPAKAFLVTGRPAFNTKRLQAMHEEATKTQPDRYIIAVESGTRFRAPRGPLAVYVPPIPGHDYTVAADPSAGVEGGDPACIQVFDRMTNEQVACWSGYLAPVNLARIAVHIGEWYNHALIAPELTGGHGFAMVEELKHLMYPRIYVWQRVDKVKHGLTNFYGWECVAPDSKVLTANLRWVRAADIAVGDRLLGCSEIVSGRGKGSGIPLAVQTVTETRQFRAPRVEVVLDDGRSTWVSSNHPLLICRQSRKDLGWQWMAAGKVKPGDSVKAIRTWETADTYEAGRLAGFLDGEGHLVRSNRQGSLTLGISQAEGPLADEILGLWVGQGFDASVKRFRRVRRPHEQVMTVSGLAQLPEVLRALGALRPTRLLRRYEALRDRLGTLRTFPSVRVAGVFDAGEGTVVGLTTDPDHTLIVDGIVGHNTSYRTRPLLIDSFNFALNEGDVLLHDLETISEALNFQYVTATRVEGAYGHDDRIMAMMIAYRVHLEWPMPNTGLPPRLKFEEKHPAPEEVPMPKGTMNHEAWTEADELLKRAQHVRTPQTEYDNPDQYDDTPEDGLMGDAGWVDWVRY